MIDLYTWTTPNGRKASIALEELGLPYTAHAVDIGKDEQFKPEFLKISPNNRIPAIVDRDNGMSLMESGAILIYLADKTGKLLPKSGEARYKVIEWLMWQMGGPGPMLGQVHHFVKYNKGKAPYAEERYLKEAHRLYGVLDKQLATTNTSPVIFPSPISRCGRGFRATSGRRSISTPIPTSSAGTSPSPSGRRPRRATRCRRTSAKSRCHECVIARSETTKQSRDRGRRLDCSAPLAKTMVCVTSCCAAPGKCL